jgi:putative transcriptional regulator
MSEIVNDYGSVFRKIISERKQHRSDERLNERAVIKDSNAKYNCLIEDMRVKKDWSMNKLSLKSHIARGYISELCNGVYDNPSLDVLVKLAKAFKCTLNDLVEIKVEG